jgi:hypothetical protein
VQTVRGPVQSVRGAVQTVREAVQTVREAVQSDLPSRVRVTIDALSPAAQRSWVTPG